jgi:hypothetical protein
MDERALRILRAIDDFPTEPKLIKINEDVFYEITNDANTSYINMGDKIEVHLFGINVELTNLVNGWEIL